jgi:hypothetical protein
MKYLLTGSALLTALFAAMPARAEVDEFGAYNNDRDYSRETEQDTAVEFRFGRYVPNVDDGLAAKPYEHVFGPKNRYYLGLEIDWQALRIPMFGTFGPGFSIGYTRSTADAIVTATGARSDQPTSLSIVPMYVVGVLRADVFAREASVPLVPYAKLGLGYALWWVKNGDDTAESDGKAARGRSYGLQMALGMMLQLDWIDIDDARSADAHIGMNHSYVFAEWYRAELDGFGSDDQLDAGTHSWMAGIAVEF